LALGYEDLNDHDTLRHDPLLAVLVGKGRSDGAGPSLPQGSRQGVGGQEHVEPFGTDARGGR
jgi:hypothetical protein